MPKGPPKGRIGYFVYDPVMEEWDYVGQDLQEALCHAVLTAGHPDNMSEIALIYETTRTRARRVASIGVTWTKD